MKNLRSGIKIFALATMIDALCGPKLVLSAEAPRVALNAIIEGAKKEGKVSWGSYLDDAEVGDLNKAFQKEFPFVKVEYTRLRPPYERLLLEMQAGNFPYDTMAIRPNLVGQHRQLGYLIDPIDWKSIFSLDPRMVHPEGIAVSVITNPAIIAYNKNLVPKQYVPKSWADCYNPYFKGKLAVLVGASQVVTLWGAFGEQWGVDFAKKVLNNNPRWSAAIPMRKTWSPPESCSWFVPPDMAPGIAMSKTNRARRLPPSFRKAPLQRTETCCSRRSRALTILTLLCC